MKRNNPKEGKYRKMREQAQNGLPPRSSGHLPVVDRLETTEQKVRKEIAIMKKLRHPHIVRLFEVIDDRLKDRIYMGESSVPWFRGGSTTGACSL